ncbi:hypothetical protein L596_021040 [Steinernema carpocapsae]|uniref:Uncharacterized protein n=1 Tax=Steinernema carpocapsae TaxID=34508 RepID=A0A4U5MV91_STECR|nr:hypothetical protein L596_021040 [Steinernema carpocapsae]
MVKRVHFMSVPRGGVAERNSCLFWFVSQIQYPFMGIQTPSRSPVRGDGEACANANGATTVTRIWTIRDIASVAWHTDGHV